jgi:hypothetical protein
MSALEPPRNNKIDSLKPAFARKVKLLLAKMTAYGFDPVVFEARRSVERQKWLYGVGRTHDTNRKPVTWTKKSNHFDGNAVDIVSHSKLWNHPKFFARLKVEAVKLGLHVIPQEDCHIQADKP